MPPSLWFKISFIDILSPIRLYTKHPPIDSLGFFACVRAFSDGFPEYDVAVVAVVAAVVATLHPQSTLSSLDVMVGLDVAVRVAVTSTPGNNIVLLLELLSSTKASSSLFLLPLLVVVVF